jgi:hypothetical protein
MKFALAASLMIAVLSAHAQGQHWVAPHYDRNGNFIQGHWQTNPDATKMNNWSTQGNVNPYTGQPGTVNPFAAPNIYAPQQYQQQQRQQQCGYNAYGRYVCQ